MPRNPDGSGSDPYLHPKTKAAIGYILSGQARTQREAARLAGMRESHLSRALHKPHVQAYAVEAARFHLRGFPAVAAAARLASLVDAKSEEVAHKVASRLTEAAGILDTREQVTAAGTIFNGPVMVVNFRHLRAPEGAEVVQLDHPSPAPPAIPAVTAADHALAEGGVLDSGGSDRGEGVEKTEARANSPPRRAVETPDG